jgi:hypothetical protein
MDKNEPLLGQSNDEPRQQTGELASYHTAASAITGCAVVHRPTHFPTMLPLEGLHVELLAPLAVVAGDP